MRAHYHENENGEKIVTAMKSQGSSKLSTLATSNCLLIRDIDAKPAKAGDKVKIVVLNS